MNEFEILEEIGKGGMATIYRGKFKDTGKEIVVKKLHPHLKDDEHFVNRFKREAKILEKLKHRNIITFYGFKKIKGEYFILMEYIQGLNLRDILKKGKIPLLIALYITREIYEGIGYAHKNGIIHRDLKPGNIIIGKNGGIKIADFGLAYGAEFPRVTDPGMYVGTPEYIAPEILMGKAYSEKSDIYAIGVILYEMIKGENPFRGKTPYESINKTLYRKKINISFGDLPAFLEPIINKMIALEPKARYKNIEELKRNISSHITISKRTFKQWLSNPENFYEGRIIKSKTIKNIRMLILLIILLITLISYNYFHNKEYKTSLPPQKTKKIFKNPDTLKAVNIPEDTVKRSKVKPVTGYGWLKISAIPWAEIYIDKKFIDRTPIAKSVKVAFGKHTVIFKHPGRGEIVKTLNINSSETLKVNVKLDYGYLKIVVIPWGYVYVDGEKVVETPVAKPIPIKPGVHNLLVVNPEYREWREKINIARSETLEKHITLKK